MGILREGPKLCGNSVFPQNLGEITVFYAVYLKSVQNLSKIAWLHTELLCHLVILLKVNHCMSNRIVIPNKSQSKITKKF